MRLSALLAFLLVPLVGLSDEGRVAATERVTTTAELARALASARPGTVIVMAPGEYVGFHAAGVTGTAAAPVVIRGEDAGSLPVFRGAVHLSDFQNVQVSDLVIENAPTNGLNIDDGGTYATPTRGVVLRDVTVRDCGGGGNHDGIKLSGVDDFRLEKCTVERWGRGGSAVDMVGCHRGTIVECTFRDRETSAAASGVQMKGGTSDVVVRSCRFEHAGERAVNIGGSTGLEYFRPKADGFEARAITVERSTFIGSTSPVAFVGVDGAVVRRNTFYRPRRWVARILQETRQPGFVACRNGVFEDNLIAYMGNEVVAPVNVGDGTAPETFVFARNWWFCIDEPKRPAPGLPTAEKDAAGGADPLFRDGPQGDLRLREGSPARAYGAESGRGG